MMMGFARSRRAPLLLAISAFMLVIGVLLL